VQTSNWASSLVTIAVTNADKRDPAFGLHDDRGIWPEAESVNRMSRQ
jgi:hypothetical protein